MRRQVCPRDAGRGGAVERLCRCAQRAVSMARTTGATCSVHCAYIAAEGCRPSSASICGSALCAAGERGDIDERHVALRADLAYGGVVCVDFRADARRAARVGGRERGRAPVRNRQRQHMLAPPLREAHRALQQPREAHAEFLHRPTAVLVVDPDQQADQIVFGQRLHRLDRRLQLIAAPPGLRDEARVRHGNALHAQRLRQLHRPAPGLAHAFADGVRIAERQIAQFGDQAGFLQQGGFSHAFIYRSSQRTPDDD